MNKEAKPMTAEELIAAVAEQTRPTETEKLEYLRDHFAGLAMQGLLAQSCGTALNSDPKFAAYYAYAMADAMMKAREQ